MVASKWQYVGSVDYKFNGSGRMVGAWVNVPAMDQYPNLPDGCESVALANMLRYYGFPTSNTTIWNSYLSFSDWNFVSAYAMGGCMAPAIRDAANRYLSARGSSLRAQDVTGSSRSDIYWYLQYGIPVQVWGTVNNGGEPGTLRLPSGTEGACTISIPATIRLLFRDTMRNETLYTWLILFPIVSQGLPAASSTTTGRQELKRL